MTFEEVIRAAIPGADEPTVDHILWGRTPFPMGKITARSLYEAARRWDRACKSGRELCDFCDRPQVSGKFYCDRCAVAFL
jgi:hypothetical protein